MQLAGKLAAFNLSQRNLLIQPVTSEKLSRPVEQKPRGNTPLAHLENALSGQESPGFGVGEALDDLELICAKPRKTLGAPIGERHHDLDLLRRSHFDSSPNFGEISGPRCDSPSARPAGQTGGSGCPRVTGENKIASFDGHVTGKARIVHHRICGLTVLKLKLGEPPAAVEPYFFESLTIN